MTTEEFDSIYRNNYPILYKLAFSILRDDEECKDLVNEVFTDLLDNEDNNSIKNINGYLFRTVRNKALSLISHRSTLERFKQLYPIEVSASTSYDSDYDRKLLRVLDFLDSNLTPNARDAIRLVFEKGLSYKDAANQLDVSVAMINKHIVKTLKMLRIVFGTEKLKSKI